MWLTRGGAAAVLVAAMLSSGCGEFLRQSRSPSQLVIVGILTGSGIPIVIPGGDFGSPILAPTFAAGPLPSSVPAPGQPVINDLARVTLRVILKDPGASGAPTTPSSLNAVTITRYTVTYKRFGGPEGQNVPGVDVPRPIDGALTMTIQGSQTSDGVIELVRHVAKREAPLAALGNSPVQLTMIAEVTFYGRDQAGNAVSATGNVQIIFGNFG